MNNNRGGFVILMMFAFAVILLGLALAFYGYCNRSVELSSEAVRQAQMRLALHGAIQFVTAKIQYQNPYAAVGLQGPWPATTTIDTIFGTTSMLQSFDDTSGPANPRAKNTGFYRIMVTAGGSYRLDEITTAATTRHPEITITAGTALRNAQDRSAANLQTAVPFLPTERRRFYQLQIWDAGATYRIDLKGLDAPPNW